MLQKISLGAVCCLLFVASISSSPVGGKSGDPASIVDDFENGAGFVHWVTEWGEAVWERLEYDPDEQPELPAPIGSGLVSLTPPSHGQGSIGMTLGGVQLQPGASLRVTYWVKELVEGALNFHIELDGHKRITLTGVRDPTQFTSRTVDLEIPEEGLRGRFSLFAYLPERDARIVIDEISICTSADENCEPLEHTPTA